MKLTVTILAICLSLIAARSISSFSFSNNGQCNSIYKIDKSGNFTTKTCQRTANLTIGDENGCNTFRYVYQLITVTPTQVGVTQNPNNGKEICTQEVCSNSAGAQPVDCAVAFNEGQLATIRSQGNN